ncbi:MAG: SDR family oxidoreductase [Candidatus Levybacteria bacterium]|nr:SDR family oxidoreductase [Candidatus Levybacteria bacterium]
MKILGTGLDGLVGSRIVELLGDKYAFENLSISTGIDITNRDDVLEKVKNSDAQIVLHLAAKTNVDGCELDKPLGEKGDAWRINVCGTQNVVDGCLQSNKKLIYISTDFVFDGTNPPLGGYSEEDIPNPINWYAKTKYEGEKIVQNLKTPWIIARIASPYRAMFERLDFARAILKRLQDGLPVAGVTDHIFTPTFIDDIVVALYTLIENSSQGIFHVVGSQSLTPFDASHLIAKEFDLDGSQISQTTRTEFFNNRAPRSFQLALKNDKIGKLGIKMKTFEEGLKEIKSQMSKNNL